RAASSFSRAGRPCSSSTSSCSAPAAAVASSAAATSASAGSAPSSRSTSSGCRARVLLASCARASTAVAAWAEAVSRRRSTSTPGGARGLEGGLLALEPLGEGVELASAVDALQRGDGGVRCGPCGLFGAPRPLGGRGGLVGPRGHGGEVLLGEFGQRREPQPGRMLLECRDLLVLEGSGLGEAGERRPEGLPGGIDLTPRLLAHLLELLLHAVVDLGAEHALQHGLALGGAGAQEAGELVLRQQHRLRELLAGQPDGALDLAAHLVDAGGDHVE